MPVFSLAHHKKCDIFSFWRHANAQCWSLSFGFRNGQFENSHGKNNNVKFVALGDPELEGCGDILNSSWRREGCKVQRTHSVSSIRYSSIPKHIV